MPCPICITSSLINALGLTGVLVGAGKVKQRQSRKANRDANNNKKTNEKTNKNANDNGKLDSKKNKQ